jgi:hypothetical protein
VRLANLDEDPHEDAVLPRGGDRGTGSDCPSGGGFDWKPFDGLSHLELRPGTATVTSTAYPLIAAFGPPGRRFSGEPGGTP